MRTALPLGIVTAFAERLNININPVEMRSRYRTIEVADVANVVDIVNQVQEVGKFCGLSFIERRVSEDDFFYALDSNALPALVFIDELDKNDAPVVRPFIITAYRKSMVEGVLIVEEDDEILQVSASYSFRALAAKLRQPRAESWGNGNGASVFMLSPLKIEPTVSGPEDEPHLTPLQRLWRLLSADRKEIGYVYIYATAVGVLSLTLPLGVQSIVNLVAGGLFLEPIAVLITFVIFATLLSGALQIMQIRIVESLKQRIFAKAAFEFAFRTPLMRLEALNKYYPPELMNRFFDILTIQKGYTKLLTDILTAALQILFGLILLTFYHPFFVFFGLALVLLLLLLFRATGRKGLESSLMESKYKYKVAHWLEELARSMTAFKLAGYTNLGLDRTDREVSYYLKKRQSHFRVLIGQYGGIVVFKVLITAGVLILGSFLVIERQITLGQFVASEIVIITIIAAVEKLILNLESVYDVLTAVDKVGHVTDVPLDRQGGVSMTCVTDNCKTGFAIRIQNLKYKYPEATTNALNGVTLEIAENESVGIVGEYGAGKTTLIKVVTGLLESYQGNIAYNGLSLRDVNITSLRDYVGDNLSSTEIFEGTIEENIAVGKPDVHLTDVMRALEEVGLTEYINSLPDGVHTRLVSGGRQQPSTVAKKIILARSLAESPRLLVFDDFFLNMSNTFNDQLTDRIFNRARQWTILAATHNPIVLSKCDRVALLENGKIARIATYKEMLDDPKFMDLIPTVQRPG